MDLYSEYAFATHTIEREKANARLLEYISAPYRKDNPNNHSKPKWSTSPLETRKILYSLSHKSDEFNKWWENFDITDISKMILSTTKKPSCPKITHRSSC